MNPDFHRKILNPQTAVVFDWGDTLMRDFPEKPGPMCSWEHVETIAGVHELLNLLVEKGYILTVATNAGVSDTALMREALRRVDIEKYFTHFFSSQELQVSKPDPRFFLEVALRIGKHPSDCLLIGNDYQKDIVAARSAGMHTAFFNEKAVAGQFPDADYVFGSMKLIFGLFQHASV